MAPFWDQVGECFYRFSYQELPEVIGGDGGIRSKVYLTVLDKDLNQLGETLLPQLTKRPGKHFAKDGEIWIYENMNDEMGFVRLNMRKIEQILNIIFLKTTFYFYKQFDAKDCGPNCRRIVAKYNGEQISLKEIREFFRNPALRK